VTSNGVAIHGAAHRGVRSGRHRRGSLRVGEELEGGGPLPVGVVVEWRPADAGSLRVGEELELLADQPVGDDPEATVVHAYVDDDVDVVGGPHPAGGARGGKQGSASSALR